MAQSGVAMRTEFLALPAALFFCLQASACPDLTGRYTCNGNDISESLVITQEVSDTLKVIVNDAEILVDGKSYPMTGDPSLRNASIRSWCEDKAIKSQMTGELYEADQKIGDVETTIEYVLGEDGIVEMTSSRVKTAAGESPTESTLTCTRDPKN